MFDYIVFWLSKAVADSIVAIVIVAILLFIWLLVFLWDSFKQARCPHTHYYETPACDAICRKCSLNLGFIQHVRDRDRDQRRKE